MEEKKVVKKKGTDENGCFLMYRLGNQDIVYMLDSFFWASATNGVIAADPDVPICE